MDTYASHLWILRKANNNTKIVALYVPNEATEDDFTIVTGETYYNAEEQKENIKAERVKSRMMKTITKMYNNNVNNEKDPPLEGLKSINVGGFVSVYFRNKNEESKVLRAVVVHENQPEIVVDSAFTIISNTVVIPPKHSLGCLVEKIKKLDGKRQILQGIN